MDDRTEDILPLMPVAELVEEISQGGDGSYADGDNPGWFSTCWDQGSQQVTMKYEPDLDGSAQYRLTERKFQLLIGVV